MPHSKWANSVKLELLKNEMYYVGIRLVIPIVFFCIYFSQAAFLRPAGGWAPVPAALPTVVRGEGKPAGPKRQWAGWWGSQGGSAGEDSLGERQDSDHQRVRRRGRQRRGTLTYSSHLNTFAVFVFGPTVQSLEKWEVKTQQLTTDSFLMQSGAERSCGGSSPSVPTPEADPHIYCGECSNCCSQSTRPQPQCRGGQKDFHKGQ